MRKIIFYIFCVVLITSCTKQINVDLKNATQQLVIEGNVSNIDIASVLISKTVPFSSSNNFPAVSGATVTITDDGGTVFPLTENSAGHYTNSSLLGEPGHSYTMTVTTEGKSYTAVSTMPQQVNIDTILLENIAFGNKFIWAVKPQYTDPPGFGNYYKFTEFINDVRNPTIFVWDDRFVNNGISTRPLLQADSAININDSVGVEMQCLDKNTFRYFSTLAELQRNATTPTNPNTNISGGVLGYFSAHTTQRKKVVVK